MPFSEDDLKTLPGKVAQFVRGKLQEELQNVAKALGGCNAICNFSLLSAAGKLVKAAKDLNPKIDSLTGAAKVGPETDAGRTVSFDLGVIQGVATSAKELFGALSEFLQKAGSVVSAAAKEVISTLGDVLNGFCELLLGNGFLCGFPDVSKLTSLDGFIPDALKNAKASLFHFLMDVPDVTIAKYGVIGATFLSLIKPKDVATDKGLSQLQKAFENNEDEELSGLGILALLKIGLTEPTQRDRVQDMFKAVAVDEKAPAGKKAKAAAGLTMMMAASAAEATSAAIGKAASSVKGMFSSLTS